MACPLPTPAAPAGRARWAPPAVLLAACGFLFVLIVLTDGEAGLFRQPSNRYRFHAIPVALSQLYHGRAHDYTANLKLAHRFQDTGRGLDELIAEAIHRPPADDTGTYFWVADDRGLSDFVAAAFALFGPRTVALAGLYYVLLGGGVLLFAAGFWRTPAALLAPVLVLGGLLAFTHLIVLRTELPWAGGPWREPIALYESRLFDLLALVPWLHLALVVGLPKVSRAAVVTAVPQAAVLLVLYHARSSLGWQYLALAALAAFRVIGWAWRRWRTAETPPAGVLVRPVLTAGLVLTSLGGLGQYQRAAYHPEYFGEKGVRTFWHNALHGYFYHPKLRGELCLPAPYDRDVIELVLKRMRDANDPRLDPTWTTQHIFDSLGGHYRFNWVAYERVCREIYSDVWRTRPAEAAACYAWHKPADVAGQVGRAGAALGREVAAGRAANLVLGLVGVAVALGAVIRHGRRDPEARVLLGTLTGIVAVLLPFSLIPGVAFYSTLTTLACFYVGLVLAAGVFAVRVGLYRRTPAVVPAPSLRQAA